jgi:hypothetical protein
MGQLYLIPAQILLFAQKFKIYSGLKTGKDNGPKLHAAARTIDYK